MPLPGFYTHYHSFHIPTQTLKVEQWDDIAWRSLNRPYLHREDGLREDDALKIINIWNRGTHHDYRYWLE